MMQNEVDDKSGTLSLADRVAAAVVGAFDELKLKSGKPTIRSNGIKEWTVLAGLVALIDIPGNSKDVEVVPISIATGVKALPNRVRAYSKGTMVQDLHAEILTLRLFNWFLLDECSRLKNNTEDKSRIIESLDDANCQFRMKKDVKLALFITEPPCGDASMSYLTETLVDNEPWKNAGNKRQKLDIDEGVIRGRGNFDKLGIVRTKPGRSDSLITLSKSCSDKLCLKQLTGITNTITSHIFPEEIYIDYLVLPKAKFKENDIDRCFHERFVQKLKENDKAHPFKAIGYTKDDYKFHKPIIEKSSSVPSQLSLLYVVPVNYVQVLNDGVKNGSSIKNKAPKTSGESIICNHKLYQKADPLLNHNETEYLGLKKSNSRRQALKQSGQGILKTWIPTGIDDFTLHTPGDIK